jgi:pimeloyl-ACP methyl ester carboxylesterase
MAAAKHRSSGQQDASRSTTHNSSAGQRGLRTAGKALAATALLAGALLGSGCAPKQPDGEIQGLTGFAMTMERSGAGLERKTIKAAGYEIPYLEGGKGEPLILVHGFGGNKDNFTRVAKFLTPKMRVIIPDLPGFGATEKRPDDDFSIEKQAERINEFAKALGIDKHHIGGNSMGGWISGIYAAKYPDATQTVWFLNPAGTQGGTKSEALVHFAKTGKSLLTVSNREEYERLLDLIFVKRPSPMPGFVIDAMTERAVADKAMNDKIYGVIRGLPVDMPQRVAAAGFKNPSLVVWGDKDRVLHPDGASELAAAIPGSTLIMMKDMGHSPQLERPEETAMDYLKFRKLN